MLGVAWLLDWPNPGHAVADFFGRAAPTETGIVSSPDRVTLVAVGDIMLSRTVADKIDRHGVDYPFQLTRELTDSADIAFGNLETPITAGRHIRANEMVFRADPDVVGGLQGAGFSVLSLANNHVPNFGPEGVEDTLDALEAADIMPVGAGRNSAEAVGPAVIEVRGTKFAFLAFNDTDVVPDSYGAGPSRAGTALMDVASLTAAIQAVRPTADVVIVSMHSGTEYVFHPNASQREFARAAIDAGADLVIGHHPHVVQSAERYRGKYIFYSLGNFVFDQMWSRETREGLAVSFTFEKSELRDVAYHPVVIDDYSQPRLVEGEEAARILARLQLSDL